MSKFPKEDESNGFNIFSVFAGIVTAVAAFVVVKRLLEKAEDNSKLPNWKEPEFKPLTDHAAGVLANHGAEKAKINSKSSENVDRKIPNKSKVNSTNLSSSSVSSHQVTSDSVKGSSRMNLNERQEKIVKMLESKKELTMNEIIEINSGVTERTLRRDLDSLEKMGYVIKEGKTKGAKYILK